MTIEPHVIALLTLMCVFSGFIDAIAGGGGLITVPGLLFAGIPPINVLATNKMQSVMGTTMATFNFARKGHIEWTRNRLTVLTILIASSLGAVVVQMIDPKILQLVVPVLLVAVAAYVLLSPRMSDTHAHHRVSSNGYAPLGGLIGFYDGFFGPGTGAFFTASLVGLRGYGLTKSTALTKLFNVTSNIGSVIVFALSGKMLWVLGLCMAAGSMLGGWLGSHTAMRFGAKVIRPLLVTISLCLTARLVWTWFIG